MKQVIYINSNGIEKTVKVERIRKGGWFLADDGWSYWINQHRTQIYRVWGSGMRFLSNQIVIAG